jgi:hypothetical protein
MEGFLVDAWVLKINKLFMYSLSRSRFLLDHKNKTFTWEYFYIFLLGEYICFVQKRTIESGTAFPVSDT